jgi:hypothetical protein
MLRVNLFSVSVYNNALLLIVVLWSCPVWSSNCLTGKQLSPHNTLFQPNHWIVGKHFRTDAEFYRNTQASKISVQ